MFRDAVKIRLSYFAPVLQKAEARKDAEPLIAYNATPFHPALAARGLTTLYLQTTDESLSVPSIDGHHRIFMHKLLGITGIRSSLFWDPAFLRFNTPETLGLNYEGRIYEYLGGSEVEEPSFQSADAEREARG
jgi:hypothetical protein